MERERILGMLRGDPFNEINEGSWINWIEKRLGKE
jgi:hypothetical protein